MGNAATPHGSATEGMGTPMASTWVGGVVGLALLGGCCATSPVCPTSSTPVSPPDRAAIERLMQAPLPERAEQVEAWADTSGMDDSLFLRVELSAADLDAFVQRLGIERPLSTTRRFVHNHQGPPSLAWWTPDDVPSFESGTVLHNNLKNPYGVSILIDLSQGRKTVYVFVAYL